ncbi:hypothetical protein SAMN05446635_5295 [Burkholderia sp. OK233]|nr:hypothetical protein SAMN05446635_5295 [Burkholderia sp. OK233]
MPVTHFYARTMYSRLSVAVPQPLVALGEFVGARAKHMNDAYENFHLDHCENIARRAADISFYEQAISDELKSADMFGAALILPTQLTGYLGSVKSFLDAIAVCLNDLFSLKLAPLNIDLCRPKLLEMLAAKDAVTGSRYAMHSDFYAAVIRWRNAAEHQVAPLVFVCGTTEARRGLETGQTSRADVEIRLVNQPGLRPSDVVKLPGAIKWTQPDSFFPIWRVSIDHLLKDVCEEIIAHCPDGTK